MSLQALISSVFRRGCNLNLQTVLASGEYRRLRNETLRLGIATPEQSALVQLLGVRLATRAFQNMPWAIRSQVPNWHNGVEAQMALLRLISTKLRSERWRQSATRTYEYNSDYRCVLPAETGSWSRGTVKPNCLGIAQMMVGFAQAVQAPHYLANVIRANQDELLSCKIRALNVTQKLLGQHTDMTDLQTKVEQAYITLLEGMSGHYQAHHALVIQTDDGKWWVVDPYLNAFYSLIDNPKRDKSLESLAMQRDTVRIMQPSTPRDTFTKMINMRLMALQSACNLVTIGYEKDSKLRDSILIALSYIEAHTQLCDSPADGWDDFTEQLTKLQYAASQGNGATILDSLATFGLIYAVHDIEDISKLTEKIVGSSESVRTHLRSCMKRASQDIEYEKKLAIRLIRLMVKNLIAYLDSMQDDADARHHECLEFTWAPMGIGAATLNHMQYEAVGTHTTSSRPGGRPATLRGELAALFAGQWVLYDALAIAQETGESIDPKYLPAILRRLQRLEEMPEIMIPPLRFYVSAAESESVKWPKSRTPFR